MMSVRFCLSIKLRWRLARHRHTPKVVRTLKNSAIDCDVIFIFLANPQQYLI